MTERQEAMFRASGTPDGSRLQTLYQPIVRLADRVPLALEVLVRMVHPTLGTVLPDAFVPRIEIAGLSRPLTEAVVRRAFEDHRRHLAPLGLKMGLNVPLDVLMHHPFLDWLEEQRRDAGLAADRITIELTESLPVAALSCAALNRLRLAMEHVRRLGYGLAIDDVSPVMPDYRALFGMPFTAMKLDKQVVIEASADPDAALFLREAVSAAKRAGLKIVAEGVENFSTWHRMRALGVDGAQGFLVARPLTAQDVRGWLESWMADAPAFASA
jgi:EAL domain-containing protein (putative c-di-GMP-specific phosphodiesterase class I)